MDSWTKVRSQIAVTKRRNPQADVTELKRELKAAHLEDYVRRVVDSAPPLTEDQRSRIAALLRSGGRSNVAA